MRHAIVTAICLAVAAAGFQLTRIASSGAAGGNQAAGWVRTDGHLIQLNIIYIASLKYPSYRADPLYSYEVDGRRYTGSGMFGASSATTIEALKRQLQPWLTASAQPTLQPVPVYYDPGDPARSAFGEPSATTGSWRTLVWWLGAILMSLSVGAMVLLGFDSRARLQHDRERIAHTARTAAGLKPPSAAEEREFVRIIDAAMHAVENAMREDSRYRPLQSALDVLERMRAKPAAALLHEERTGFGRWLSGELDVDNWGPAGARVVAAARQVDHFHERWRYQERPGQIASR